MSWGRRRPKGSAPLSADEVEGRALAIVARRDHGVAELRRKLRDRGCAGHHIDQTIDRFLGLRYLDDDRVGRGYARSLIRKGWGPRGVRAKLGERRFERELIDAIGLELDDEIDWEAAASRRLRSKARPRPEDPEEARAWRERCWRQLARRGFSGGHAREAVRRLEAGEEEE